MRRLRLALSASSKPLTGSRAWYREQYQLTVELIFSRPVSGGC